MHFYAIIVNCWNKKRTCLLKSGRPTRLLHCAASAFLCDNSDMPPPPFTSLAPGLGLCQEERRPSLYDVCGRFVRKRAHNVNNNFTGCAPAMGTCLPSRSKRPMLRIIRGQFIRLRVLVSLSVLFLVCGFTTHCDLIA